MDSLLQDLRFALRTLRKSPGFTSVAVLTLALGIGANTTMFTLVDRVLLRPLPGVRDPGRLVTLSRGPVSYPAFRDVREAMKTTRVAGWRNRQFVLSEGGASRVVVGHVVSGNYFGELGVAIAAGRLLTDADDVAGGEPVAVVSERFWRESLNGDPAIVGRKIVLNGAPVTVVGVAGSGFRGLLLTAAADLWLPIHAWPAVAPRGYARLDIDRRNWGWLTLVGRLEPMASMAQAQSEASVIQRRLFEAYPRQDASTGTTYDLAQAVTTATNLRLEGRHDVVTFVLALMGVVGLVLLITCANVANLTLARSAGRRKEMALRLALGARKVRLLRQLLSEALVLALLGGSVAVLFASAATTVMAKVTLPGGISVGAGELAPDTRVLAFTALVALLASVLFGLMPAFRAARTDVAGGLRDAMAWGRHDRLRYPLIAGQVALCVVLISGAGLFARGLARALSIPPGFRTDHIAMATTFPGLTRLDGPTEARYLEESTARIASHPGVRAVAWTELVPMVGDQNTLNFAVPGYLPAPGESMVTDGNFVGPDFFAALEVPLVAGRAFTRDDRDKAPPVVVVSEAMARRYWPGRDPVGQPMTVDDGVRATVVGVVPDVRWRGLVGDPIPTFYLPIAQRAGGVGNSELTLLARTDVDPATLLTDIRETLRATNPSVPVGDLGTFKQAYASLLAPQRTGVALLGAFSGLALLLAGVGIAGVVAHGVAQRRKEIGIRMALGAGQAAVQRLAVTSSLKAVLLGLGVGVVLAGAATRAIAGFLYGVSPTDLVTFAGTVLLLAGAALLAAWWPARKATRVDPMVALRTE